MSINNKKVKFVPIEPENLDWLYAHENSPQVWKVSNVRVPLSKYALAKYIENSHRDIWESKEQRLIIADYSSNKPLGTVELFDFDPYHGRAGVGIIIFDTNDRKKGYAQNALSLLMDYAKNELGIRQLYANIAQSNEPSILLFEKLGFKKTGHKQQWLKIPAAYEDELFYQVFL